TTLPAAEIVRAAMYLRAISADLPTAMIRWPLIATEPFSITWDEPSIVTTVPPRTIRSTRSAAIVLKGMMEASSERTKDELTRILLNGSPLPQRSSRLTVRLQETARQMLPATAPLCRTCAHRP